MYVVGEIIKVKVSGIEPYGIFVLADNDYAGLIHISEIDNNFVKDINSYVKIGDIIYASIINVDVDNKQLSLSIKNMNYTNNEGDTRVIKESISGFLPLYNNLDKWLDEKVREIKTFNEVNPK